MYRVGYHRGGSAMTDPTLETAVSPEQVIDLLRKSAAQYYESAGELESAWQDPHAGKIWEFSAREFESVAAKIEKRWSRV
jgi:hypothetical protein